MTSSAVSPDIAGTIEISLMTSTSKDPAGY